jgi:hypothetical protein
MSSERVLPSHFSVDERMQSDRVPRPVTGKFQSVHSINGLSNRSNSLGRSDVKGRSIENYSRLIKQHTEKDAYDERILNEKTRGSHKGEATSLSQQFQHASNMFFNRWWLWELFACFVTLCALIGIVVVLARFNNNPLPNWPYHIGINSLISVFTTLLKAAMLLVLTEGLCLFSLRIYGRLTCSRNQSTQMGMVPATTPIEGSCRLRSCESRSIGSV